MCDVIRGMACPRGEGEQVNDEEYPAGWPSGTDLEETSLMSQILNMVGQVGQ